MSKPKQKFTNGWLTLTLLKFHTQNNIKHLLSAPLPQNVFIHLFTYLCSCEWIGDPFLSSPLSFLHPSCSLPLSI